MDKKAAGLSDTFKQNTTPKNFVKNPLKGTNFTIRVVDNGTGIPNNIEDKIFEPNFTTKNSGMGLGLAIVKKIIKDFYGTIDYKTSTKGTAFEFTIPMSNNK